MNIKPDSPARFLWIDLTGRRRTMTLGRSLLALISLVLAACSINAVSDSPTGGEAGGGSSSVGGVGGQSAPRGGTGGESATGGSSAGGNSSAGGSGGAAGTLGQGGGGEGGSSGTGGNSGNSGNAPGGHGGSAPGTGGSVPSLGGTPGGQGGSSSSKDAGSPATGGSAGPDAGTKADSGTATVSYSKDIQPFLNKNCTSCHGSSSPTAGIDLSTYTKVKSNATRANSAIQGGAMPPGGGLSAADKQMFQAWVTQGAQNN
jgi:hypothetical protein